MVLPKCDQCGAELPPNAPQGLCPRCLLSGQLLRDDAREVAASDFRLKAGSVIGRYKLVKMLGEGGFGMVYVAEQSEPLKRQVALKVIKPGMDSHQVVARFEAERQVLALLDHPNIAKVFDAGTTESGRPYFVMELVEGSRLTDYCDRHNLRTTERLKLFMGVCDAIQHAHQKGIIHRDIKPSNILVDGTNGGTRLKVIDFGIAKAIQGGLSEETVHTQLNQLLGTPAYMSPEQAGMGGLDIDTRTDIYSLGVLLYELITGKTPFEPKELLRAGVDEMRRTIREQEPARPSTRLSTMLGEELAVAAKQRQTDSTRLIHQVQGDLDWIVMKALEKDRARRYQTANGFAMDVRRHLADEPVLAGPPSAGYRFRKFARRNRVALTVTAASAAVLIAATCVSVWQALRARQAEALARKRVNEAEVVSSFLSEVFQSPDPKRDGRTITIAERLDVAVTNLDRDFASQPARRASLQAAIGSTYHALGLDREAIRLQEKVLEYERATFGPERPETLGAMSLLARSYSHAGRRAEALKLQEQVLSLSRKINGPEHPDTLMAINNLAKSYSLAGRWGEAIKLQEDLLVIMRRDPSHGSEHPHTLLAMNNLAASYSRAGRLDAALTMQEQVLALYQKVNGPEDPDTLRAMNNLANTYFETGHKQDALKLGEEVLRLMRKVNGPKHNYTLIAMNNLARTYEGLGRRDDALKLRQQVLQLMTQVNGPKHPDTLRAIGNLAQSYYFAGRTNEALQMEKDVLEQMREVNGPQNPDTLDAMHLVAFYTYDTGQPAEASRLFEQVLESRRKAAGEEHPATLKAMAALLLAYRASGQVEAALELGQKSLELHRRALGITNANTLSAMTQLAITYQTAHRLNEAIALEEQALKLKRQQFPPGDRMIIASLDNLAACYELSDRKPDADAMRQEIAKLKTAK